MGVLLCSSVVFGSDSGSDSGSDNDDDIVGGVDHPSTVVSPPGDKGVNSEDPSATVVFRSDFGSDDVAAFGVSKLSVSVWKDWQTCA